MASEIVPPLTGDLVRGIVRAASPANHWQRGGRPLQFRSLWPDGGLDPWDGSGGMV